MELILRNLSTVWNSCEYWKIDDFQRRFEDAATGARPILYSPAILTHPCGYKIAVSLCPNGDGKGKKTSGYHIYNAYKVIFFTGLLYVQKHA